MSKSSRKKKLSPEQHEELLLLLQKSIQPPQHPPPVRRSRWRQAQLIRKKPHEILRHDLFRMDHVTGIGAGDAEESVAQVQPFTRRFQRTGALSAA